MNDLFAQNVAVPAAHNQIYVEAGGGGGYGSLNYQRVVFSKNYFMYAAGIGISTYHIKDYLNKFNPDIIIPLSVKAHYGKNHKIELGVGETYTSIVTADHSKFKPKRKMNLHTFFSIGYQYNKTTGGMLYCIAYTPLIEFNRYFRHWACVSVGYSF